MSSSDMVEYMKHILKMNPCTHLKGRLPPQKSLPNITLGCPCSPLLILVQQNLPEKDQEHSPSVFPKINFITKVIWRKLINSNEIMVLNVFKLLEIETPFIKKEPSTNKQADCTTEWLPSIGFIG